MIKYYTYNFGDRIEYKRMEMSDAQYQHAQTVPAITFITKEEYNNHVVVEKADKGQLIDDIAIWHNVFSETIIKIMLFLPYSDLGEKTRIKMVSDVAAKYNLDLVIKDFNPDYVIPERDKGVLITGLKEIDKYDPNIYQKLAQAIGLEATALHNEVIDKYEEIIKLIHSQQHSDSQIVDSIVNGGT